MKWLKALIKRDIIAFISLCFLCGAAFIWFGDSFRWIHINDEGKISDTVLWLTALGIFWYAYETYQLKISTSDHAAIQEIIMQNEFLPILEPLATNGKALLDKGRFTGLKVRNLGQGPAKYVEINIGGVSALMEWSLAANETEVIKLPPETRRQLAARLPASPKRIQLRLTYQDIYKRKFETHNIIFDRRPAGVYQLRRGHWDFKRVRTIDAKAADSKLYW